MHTSNMAEVLADFHDGREFNRLLRHLSDNLLNEDLGRMKLFLKADIGAGKLEPCSTGIDIFEEMKNSGLIAEDKTEKLQEILEDIKRIDLLNEVKDTYLPPRRVPHVLQPHPESTDDFTTVQNHLRKRFRRLSKMTPFPFCAIREIDLDHMFTNLQVLHAKKHEVSVPAQSINVSHTTETMGEIIWNETDRTVSFIEGVAGIGKTTLCRQLAYKWSKGDNLVCGHHFDLVFVLEARSLSEDLAESIRKQLFPKDFPLGTEKIYTTLKQHQNKSLLIIDGLDEIARDKRKAIDTVTDLIKGEYLDDVNIILTGRPECSGEFIGAVGKHLKITGFTRENAESYIENFFGSEKVHLANKLLGRVNSGLYKITQNPFMTFLLCVLTSEDSCDLPSDETDIIEKLVKTVFGVYARKIDPHSSVEKHTFENTLLSAAGKLALFGVENDILQFTEEQVNGCVGEDLGKHIWKSGIVNTDYSLTGMDITDCCYFGHTKIQEFLCVRHLVQLSPEDFGVNCRKLSRTSLVWVTVWEGLIDIIIKDPSKVKILLQIIPATFDDSNLPLFFVMNNVHRCDPDLQDLIVSKAISSQKLFDVSLWGYSNEKVFLRVLKKMRIIPPTLVRNYTRSVPFPPTDYDRFNCVDMFGFCVEVLQFYGSTNRRYIQFDTNTIIRHPVIRELTIPFILCFSVNKLIEILDLSLKVEVVTLTVLPDSYDELFTEIKELIRMLESTQKRISIIITLLISPIDDNLYLRIQSMFRRVNNNNVHLRFMVTDNLEMLEIPYYKSIGSPLTMWRFARSVRRFKEDLSAKLPKPSPQQYYDRFSPY